MGIDFDTALNPEQKAAVTAPDGPILVLAAAGTGKTRTLVYRVAYAVEKGIRPENILLLTFTNKAAREMLERAHRVAGEDVSGLWGGTFHHMANRILRRHAEALGYRSDFTILDRDDAEKLVSDCMKELKLLSKEFPKPDVLMGVFSSAANAEVPVAEKAERRFSDGSVDVEAVLRVHAAYEAGKRKMDAMDFDDLLTNCLALFRNRSEVIGRYQELFRHVLVDEYQDTNTIQAELVDRLAARHRNILVVGDDFQSIYSWRGANYRNIMSFGKRYADAQVYKLETNYRSVPGILEVANACIAGNPEQYQKTLRATREGVEKPKRFLLRDGGEQARCIVEQVRQLTRNGCRLSDIAVLYRAHYHAMELQLELTRAGLPYVVTSGVRFFEQAHIKDVCSVLRILENPMDQLAFTRLLRLMPGVGERTALKAWNALGGRFNASEAGDRARLLGLFKGETRKAWEGVDAILAAYARDGLREDGGEVIHRFLETFYERHAANVFENAEQRIDDIRELILYTGNFESVQQFLSDIALLTNLDSETETVRQDEQAALRLSTVHQAKGLEWPVVFVLWMNEGMFPSQRAIDDAGDDTEERRLFYVAVTRAKDELGLFVPEVRRTRDGGVLYCPPSRFVEEIPDPLLKTVRMGFI